jgi:hypothetical protein
MIAETEWAEYLAEIRKEVCSRCVERPPGGPPCAPLGKQCGVEMHLPQLVQTVRDVQSPLIEPYLAHNRQEVCAYCPLLHGSSCPCPMDYLAVLVVQAIEAVDRRRAERKEPQWPGEPATPGRPEVAAVRRTYEEATGTWRGCDWTTRFGRTGLDLCGWAAADAVGMALEAVGRKEAVDWSAAADWLAKVEQYARKAKDQAVAAVAAAEAERWEEALNHAQRAWALEFATGRPLWHGPPYAWQRLRRVVEDAALARRGQLGQAGVGPRTPAADSAATPG